MAQTARRSRSRKRVRSEGGLPRAPLRRAGHATEAIPPRPPAHRRPRTPRAAERWFVCQFAQMALHRTPETEERPDLTGPREVPDRVGARQTETESQDDAEDRGEPHHRLGCGVRSTRSYGSYSFRRVGCLLSNTGRHRRLARGRFGKLRSLWYPIHRQSRCGFHPTGEVEV